MENFYKYSSAYFVRFRKFEESETPFLQKYIYPNFRKILDKSVTDCICVDEDSDGKDCMVFFIEPIKINKFIEFCSYEELIEEKRDITIELLKIEKIDDVVDKMIKSDEYKDKFNIFFQKNLTVDIVLEKITLYGEKQLTELDERVLKTSLY